MSSLYNIACTVMNTRSLRIRASQNLISRIENRWELVYSGHLGEYGNPEKEGWQYIERHDDYFPENEVLSCASCSEPEHERDARSVYIFAGTRRRAETWCSGCVENDTFICESCDDIIATGDSCLTDDDRYLCPHCYNVEAETQEDVAVADYHGVRRPAAGSAPCWSVEIEMEFPDSSTRAAFAVEAKNLSGWLGHRLIVETDGSLDRQKGAECVLSCYESQDALLIDARALQECARRHKAIAWDLPRLEKRDAGIHISSNRVGWTVRGLMRLGYIVTVCASALKRAAGRSVHFAEYPQRATGFESRSLRNFSRGYMGKYSAVNLQTSRLEWRIFRSTLNPERIAKNLALVCELEALAKGSTPATALKAAALAIIQSHTL